MMTTVQDKTTAALLGGEISVMAAGPGWPIIGEEDAERVAAVVASGKWSWIGEQEQAFCEEYKKFIGTDYCACLANGTVTLQCALQAVGVEPGDEVIVPGLTWVATAQAALDVGANVVFADIDPLTMNLDPESFRAAITPKTKAVIPVHLYGCMADMDAIVAIAREHDIKIVEDVAHQHGSQWRGVGAGALGDAGSFSFQQSKILTSGEGGAVTCNDPKVYETVFALKQVGWVSTDVVNDPYMQQGGRKGGRYAHNYRITEMQASLLRSGLERLPEQNARREEGAAFIREKLAEIGGPLTAVPKDERVTMQAYYMMTLHYDSTQAGGLTRSQYQEALRAEGLGLGQPYDAVYNAGLMNLYDSTSPVPFRPQEELQNYAQLKLPNVERCVHETGALFDQQLLLGSDELWAQAMAAVRKVNDNLPAIKAHFDAQEK